MHAGVSGEGRADFSVGATRGWLLSTTNYDQHHAKWRHLGESVVSRAAGGRRPLRDACALIGAALNEPKFL